jgi:hypothetical protein
MLKLYQENKRLMKEEIDKEEHLKENQNEYDRLVPQITNIVQENYQASLT